MHKRSLLLHVRVHLTQCCTTAHLLDNGFFVLNTGDTLELAVFMSVKMQDEAAFERNYQQLQMYVSDTR